jgi:hypothetical protein
MLVDGDNLRARILARPLGDCKGCGSWILQVVPGTVGEHGFDAAPDPRPRHRKVRSPTMEAAGNLQRNGAIRGLTDARLRMG